VHCNIKCPLLQTPFIIVGGGRVGEALAEMGGKVDVSHLAASHLLPCRHKEVLPFK